METYSLSKPSKLAMNVDGINSGESKLKSAVQGNSST